MYEIHIHIYIYIHTYIYIYIYIYMYKVTDTQLMAAIDQVRGGKKVTDQAPENSYEALEQYGTDLTQLAREVSMDRYIYI